MPYETHTAKGKKRSLAWIWSHFRPDFCCLVSGYHASLKSACKNNTVGYIISNYCNFTFRMVSIIFMVILSFMCFDPFEKQKIFLI